MLAHRKQATYVKCLNISFYTIYIKKAEE